MSEPPPRCRCGDPARVLQVRKAGPNHGRWFATCADGKCNSFEWCAAPPPPPPKAAGRKGPAVRCFVADGRIAFRAPTKEFGAWLRAGCLPAVRYDAGSRTYTLEPGMLDDARRRIEARWGGSLAFEALPRFVASLLAKHSHSPERSADECRELLRGRIPDDLLACLRPFQAVGVHRAVELGGRVFLCDEMGLGKTVQTVAVLSYYSPADWPVLVVCPSSLRLNWRNEFRKWLHLTDDQVQIVFSSSDKISPDSRVVVVSYDLASRPATHAQLAARGFPSVVCDEAHYIKNAKALRTKALVPLLKRARRTLLLTGTPALARPIELFTSLSVLKPEVFNEAKAFGMRYCGGKEDGPTAPADFSGHSHLAELNWILRSTVMVRRLKQDVLSELPEKLRRHVYVDVHDPAAKAELAAMLAEHTSLEKRILGMEARPDKDPSLQHLKTSQIVLMGQMWSKTGTGKLPAAKEYLREALQNPEFKKAIVFAHHVEVMDGLEAFCKAEGLNPVRIDGSTKPADRQPLCDSFQRDSGVRAAVLSLNAAGVGLTLTEADLVVFAEISWTPALLLQAEDRAHRIGRVDAVTVVYLLAEGTFDTVQWEMNLAKLKIVSKTVEGDASVVNLRETGASNQPAGEKAKHLTTKAVQAPISDFFSKKPPPKTVPPPDPMATPPVGKENDSAKNLPVTAHFREAKLRSPGPMAAGGTDAPRVKPKNRPRAPPAQAPGFVPARTMLQPQKLGAAVADRVPAASGNPREAPILVYASDDEEDGRPPVAVRTAADAEVDFDDLDEGLLADLLAGIESTHISA